MLKISMGDLESKKVKRVYVLNKTTGFEKGNVVMSFPKTNGQGMDIAVVPSTFIPIEITEQVSKRQILDSNNFRAALNTGRLQLIHENDAAKMLESSIAQKEIKRLTKDRELLMNSVMDLDKLYTEVEVNTAGSQAMLTEISADGTEVAATVDGQKKKREPKLAVQALVEDLLESKDEDSAISTLMNIENLNTTDYKYVYKKCSKFSEIKSIAENLYKKLKEEKAKKKAK